MKTNGNDLCKAQLNRLNGDGEHYEFEYYDGGLTKREYFAALALQGILSNSCGGTPYTEHMHQTVAKLALAQADALIEELNK